MNNKTHKDPLFHIARKDQPVWWKRFGIRIIAVILALVVSGIITLLLTKLNPIDVYLTMIDGAVGTTRRVWALIQKTAMLLIIAVAITPAFRMRFWNIGAEGQVLIGGFATAVVMLKLGGKVPTPVLFIMMIVAAIIAGAVWGFIPAFFKAKSNTNETLFTLMMNYVAIQLIGYYVLEWSVPKGSGQIGIINQKTQEGWIPSIGHNAYLINVIIVAVITIAVAIYLNKTKHGYEISVVGESQNTARYIGIDVKKVIIRTMILSGAICGIAGFLLVSGQDHTITKDTAGGNGFTAIMVSWLAKFDPLWMVLTAFIICFLQKGAGEIATMFNLNLSFADIITGIIIFFIVGCEFFINYRIVFRNSGKEVAA